MEQAVADDALVLKHDAAARESVVRALLLKAISIKHYDYKNVVPWRSCAARCLSRAPRPLNSIPETPYVTDTPRDKGVTEMRGSVFIAALCLLLTATVDGSNKKKRKKVGVVAALQPVHACVLAGSGIRCAVQ